MIVIRRVASPFSLGGHHQEGLGQLGRNGPPRPGTPATDLMLVRPTSPAGLEALLDGPAPYGHPDQGSSMRPDVASSSRALSSGGPDTIVPRPTAGVDGAAVGNTAAVRPPTVKETACSD